MLVKGTSHLVHVLPQNQLRSVQDSQPKKKETFYHFQNFLTFRIMDKPLRTCTISPFGEFSILLVCYIKKSIHLMGKIQNSI